MEIPIESINQGEGYNPFRLDWGEMLVFPSSRRLSEFGNRVYNRYPARSIFLVPRTILRALKDTGLHVLDPFMGSGTTAVEARLSGNIPFGLEIDPFARMVAEVSSTVFEAPRLEELRESADRILRCYSESEPADIPQLHGITHWFAPGALRELLQIRAAIDKYTAKENLSFMLVAFADSIKPASLMERQSIKPYISKKYKKIPKSPSDSFRYSFEAHLAACREMAQASPPGHFPLQWVPGDATDFSLAESSVDVAITSPPYINALDYTRCIKIESAMCGLLNDEIADYVRGFQVGHSRRQKQEIDSNVEKAFAEYYNQIVNIDPLRARTCRAYFNDIFKNLACTFHALKHGAVYHMIIGDNIIRGVCVPTHEIIAKLAVILGFEWVGYYRYAIRDHRTSIPRNTADAKINIEHVIMLKKP